MWNCGSVGEPPDKTERILPGEIKKTFQFRVSSEEEMSEIKSLGLYLQAVCQNSCNIGN